MNPVVYYRMNQWPTTEKENHYVLVDSAPGSHHGVASLDPTFGKKSVSGKFGKALDFHGVDSTDHAFVSDYPKAENDQLSVRAWVWAGCIGARGEITATGTTLQNGEEMGHFAFTSTTVSN